MRKALLIDAPSKRYLPVQRSLFASDQFPLNHELVVDFVVGGGAVVQVAALHWWHDPAHYAQIVIPETVATINP